MKMHRDRIKYIFFAVFCILLCVTVCNSEENKNGTSDKKTPTKPTTQKPTTQKPDTVSLVSETPNKNNKSENETGKEESGFMKQLNKGMLLRTFYVLMGVTAIVVVYFVVRAWRFVF